MHVAHEPAERRRYPEEETGIRTPRGKGEAIALASRIGSTLAKAQRFHATKARQIAKHEEQIRLLKRNEAILCEPLEADARKMAAKLHAYVEANRDVLTQHGTLKSVRFRTGDVYRWQPFKATRIENEDAFFDEVQKLDLTEKFVRTKQEPNRAALLEEENEPQVSLLTSVEIVSGTKPVIAPSRTERRLEGILDEKGEMQWVIVDPKKRA